MIFENIVKQYIIDLKNEDKLIDADIIGVNEEFKTAKCIARFLEDLVVVEKLIYIYEINNTLNWKYLEPINKEVD